MSTSHRSSRRLQSDQGSIVAEFALIVPLLVYLFMGIFEFGMLFRQQTTFAGAVQTAARTGSHSGKNPTADKLTLTNLAATMSNMKNTVLTKVIIYKGTNANGSPPAGCTSVAPTGSGAGLNGLCNVYSPAQVASASSGAWGTTGGCSGGSWDRFWCPSTRRDTLAANPDQFGVQVTAQYTYLTKMFPGTSRSITDFAVYRIEATV